MLISPIFGRVYIPNSVTGRLCWIDIICYNVFICINKPAKLTPVLTILGDIGQAAKTQDVALPEMSHIKDVLPLNSTTSNPDVPLGRLLPVIEFVTPHVIVPNGTWAIFDHDKGVCIHTEGAVLTSASASNQDNIKYWRYSTMMVPGVWSDLCVPGRCEYSSVCGRVFIERSRRFETLHYSPIADADGQVRICNSSFPCNCFHRHSV